MDYDIEDIEISEESKVVDVSSEIQIVITGRDGDIVEESSPEC